MLVLVKMADIYEGTRLLYTYDQETSTANTKAYHSIPEGGFVGLEILSKAIELYKKDEIGSWDSKDQVLFTPEHIVVTKTELFKIKLQIRVLKMIVKQSILWELIHIIEIKW